MSPSESPPTKHRGIRPAFAIGLVALLGLGIWLIAVAPEGGQTSESPDGRYRALVMRRLNPRGSDPYKFSISDKAGHAIRRFEVTPVDGHPAQSLRGAPRVFEWSADSNELQIALDGKPWGTIKLGDAVP